MALRSAAGIRASIVHLMPEPIPDGVRAEAGRADGPPVPPLEAGACQVWWARPADARPAHDRLLEPAERARRARLLRPEDRDRLTVGTALARLVLAAQLGRRPDRLRFDRTCPFCGADHGKPRLVASGLDFSISHSGARVVVAVVRGGLVGVDVERLPADLEVDALAPQVLAEDEVGALGALPPPARASGLLTYWTRKEAVLKATGDGLRVPMPEVAVSAPDEPPSVRRGPASLARRGPASLHDLDPGAGHVAALAVLGLEHVQFVELDGGELLATAPASDRA
jgi:4'-phosphopantetheinyl transferase